MQSNHINPFLESSILVIEQVCQIRPTLGKLKLSSAYEEDSPIWLQIDVMGDMEGEIYYSIPHSLALDLVSKMMGGMTATEWDEMSQSAISELGNMISGNACMILYNQGITIDITPPRLLPPDQKLDKIPKQTLTIPLQFDELGAMNIFVNFRSKTPTA